ncbi:MAG: type IV pilus assembly protein PilM [Candidatus Chisholmbacteria bacterium]|nr:type IV pilus assembly protein PilM [Candidatus Chisholmbacteria bacterium]
MAARVGVDVGSAAIKVMAVSGSFPKLEVEAIGMGINPVGNVGTDNEAEGKQIAEAIKRTMADAGIKERKVKAALPEWQVYTRVIEVPPLSEAELASALSWEAEQYIPVPLAEVNLDWQILRRPATSQSDEKMEVLLVAAPKQIVDRRVGWLLWAGLEPVGLETEIVAGSRVVVRGDEAPTLVCNLGAVGTTVSIIEAGKLVFAYALTSGGIALTRAIAQGLGLEFAQAEQYKRTYGVDEAQLEGKQVQAMEPVLGALVTELRKGINFYAGRRKEGLKRLILTGGGAQMPGLVMYLANRLTLEVVVGNPMVGWSWDAGVKQRFEGLESVFVVAAGLTAGD